MTASKAARIVTDVIGHWTSVPDARVKITAVYNEGEISASEYRAVQAALDTIRDTLTGR